MQEAGDRKEGCEMLASGYDTAMRTALMNAQQLCFLEQDLHNVKPVQSSSMKAERLPMTTSGRKVNGNSWMLRER